MGNQNITLSLPEEDLREARISAASRGTSVSQLLARMLRQLVEQETGYADARDRSIGAVKASMSGNRRFVDTNILLYAHDGSADPKRDQARTLVEQLWESREGCLSVQVLQEFFVNVTRKIPRPLGMETAKEIIADLSRWHMHVPAADDVLGAIGIHQRGSI